MTGLRPRNNVIAKLYNMYKTIELWQEVVICSELTTFAVESPTYNAHLLVNKRISIVLRIIKSWC